MSRKSCKGCIYYRSLSGFKNSEKGCHYMLDTGVSRNCPAEECDKKVVSNEKYKPKNITLRV